MDPAQGGSRRRAWSGELVVPALVVAYCLSYVWQTSDLPGSATLWPYALIGILALLLAVLAVQLWRSALPGPEADEAPTPEEVVAGAGAEDVEDSSGATLARQIGFCVATLLFVPLVSVAGFLVTGTIYLFALSLLFGTARWYVALPGAFAISVALAYLLVRALQISFPTGWLDHLLLGA